MSDIAGIVPQRSLCEKIPEGCFANSALVYCVVGDGSGGERWYLVERKNAGETKYPEIHPAPTLEEILLEIEKLGFYCPSACHHHTWIAECECDPVDVEADPFPDAPSAADKRSGATAALLLWLDIQTDIHERNRH